MPRSTVLTVVAIAAAVFVAALVPAARAQQPGQRPDFKITQAQFDGRNLHVEYINVTGIGYPARRYEVGFQWYDSRGEPLDVRHWLPVPEVERGGVSILDNRSRTELSYRSGRSAYGKRLSQFIAERPSRATELRITVDDGDRIAEEDERNNVAFLKVPLPDIVLRDVKLTSDMLTFTYANPTETSIPGSFRIALQWMTPDGLPAGQEFSTQVGLTEPKEARQFPRYARELLYAGSGNSQTYLYTSDFVRKRQSNAEVLRISIDPENVIAESNETNNAETVMPAPPPKPDLTIETITIDKDGQPHATVWNRGAGATSSVVVAHEYRDRAGKRLERGSGSRETAPLGLGPDQKIIAALLGPIPDTAVTVAVTVDPKNAVAETDEQNNTKEGPAPMADLLVVEAKLDNGTLSLTYRNAGERRADPLSIWLHFANAQGAQIDPLYWMDVSPIRAGGTQVLANETAFAMSSVGQVKLTALFAAPPAGATHLRVLLDGPDRVVETNEGNNAALLAMPVIPVPDLTVTDLKIGKDTITWKEKNLGDTVFGNFSYLTTITWLDASGKTLSERSTQVAIGEIRAGSVSDEELSARFNIPAAFLTPPQGAAKLRVTVDAKGTVVEKDKENNAVEIVVPLPDLTVTDLTFARGKITWKEKNLGDTTFSNFTYLTQIAWLDASGKVLGERNQQAATGELRAGSSSTEEVSTRFGAPASFLTPPSGATKLRATIDPKGTVTEKDEGNNAVEIPVPLPDLTVSDLKLTKDAITWKEKNLGDTAFGNFTYLTQIAWLDASGMVLGERSIQAATVEIRAGAENTEEMSTKFGIPTAFLAPPAGTVKLRATVDAKSTVVEKDETNNAVEIKVEAAPEKLADLRIAEFTMDPITPRAGERVWFIVRVENVGSATTGTQTATGITVDLENDRVDKTLIGQFTAADIAPGKAFTHRWTKENYYGWVAVAGTHTIEVCADRAKVVLERDETNNCARKEVTVVATVDEKPKLPDLMITDATLDTAALRFWYHNRGESATASAISIWYEMVDAQGKRVGELRWINVNAAMQPRSKQQGNQLLDFATLDAERGTMTLGDFVSGAPPSATHLRLTIDGPNAHAEANEQNNSVLLLRPGVPKPDAAKPDLVLRDAKLADGTLRVTIVNVGKGSAERVMWQFKWIGPRGDKLATSDIEAVVGMLKPGAWYPVELPIVNARAFGIFRFLQDIPDGAIALEIIVDPKDAIAEADERNNTARIEFAIPDLTLGTVESRDGTLRIEAKNIGTRDAKATDIWLMWFGKSGALPSSGAVDLPAIATGGTATVSVPLDGKTEASRILRDPPQDGTRLRIFLDGSRKFEEINEQNNDRFVDRAILPTAPSESEKLGKPDLVPEALKVSPVNATAGAMLDFSAVVRNKGTGKAEASVAWFIVDFDRDDEPDVSPEPDDVKALAPNAMQAVVWEDAVEAQSGAHAVEFCVDVEEVVDELNEDNNCVSRAFTVGSGAAAPSPARSVVSPFRSILGAILSGLATPIVAGERPH